MSTTSHLGHVIVTAHTHKHTHTHACTHKQHTEPLEAEDSPLILYYTYIIAPCGVHCKKRGVTEHPRGAIFYCFRGNSMGYHGNSKILLPWGVPIHRVFYSVEGDLQHNWNLWL